MEASLTPCLRHRSATETPASCSFRIPMICSSEKRLRFMSWFLSMGQNELQSGLDCRGNVRSAVSGGFGCPVLGDAIGQGGGAFLLPRPLVAARQGDRSILARMLPGAADACGSDCAVLPALERPGVLQPSLVRSLQHLPWTVKRGCPWPRGQQAAPRTRPMIPEN